MDARASEKARIHLTGWREASWRKWNIIKDEVWAIFKLKLFGSVFRIWKTGAELKVIQAYIPFFKT